MRHRGLGWLGLLLSLALLPARAGGQPVTPDGGGEPQAVPIVQFKMLDRLIAVTGDSSPEKPDLLFRLAELFAQNEQYYRLKARELGEKRDSARQANKLAETDRLVLLQQDAQQHQQEFSQQALTQLRQLASLPKYHSYHRLDEVLFKLAFLLAELKKEDEARAVYQRLISDYPGSRFLPHAYLALAEAAFASANLELAVKLYGMVLTFRDSPVYGYALYKRGWAFYNLQDYAAASQAFVVVIEKSAGSASQATSGALLAREARKDLVRVYAAFSKPADARLYFEQHDGNQGRSAQSMMESLADVYAGIGKWSESVVVFRELLLRADNTSPKRCAWQRGVVTGLRHGSGAAPTPEQLQETAELLRETENLNRMGGCSVPAADPTPILKRR